MSDGDMTVPPDCDVFLQRIRSVGIGDLRDVAEHFVNRVVGSTSHVVNFAGGGRLRFAYRDGGELLELSAEAVVVHLDAHGRLTFGPYRSTDGGGEQGS